MGINCFLSKSAKQTYYLLLIFPNENSSENMATTHSQSFNLVFEKIKIVDFQKHLDASPSNKIIRSCE